MRPRRCTPIAARLRLERRPVDPKNTPGIGTLAGVSGSLAAALLPWLVFVVAARTGGIGLIGASLLGWATAVALAVRARHRRAPLGFELAAVVAFAALAGIGIGIVPWWHRLDDFARVLAASSLTLIAAGSIVLRRPFTEQYTEDSVPIEHAAGSAFRRVNRRLTAYCALGAAGASLSFAGGAIFDGRVASTIFNWLFPLALVLVCTWGVLHLWRSVEQDEATEDELLWASLATPPTVRRAAPPAVMARPLDRPTSRAAQEGAAQGPDELGRRRRIERTLRPVRGGAGR